MKSDESASPDVAAWFSVVSGAPPAFNDRFAELWSLSADERKGLASTRGTDAVAALIPVMTHHADDPRGVAPLAGASPTDDVAPLEVPLKDGRVVEVCGAPVRGDGGDVIGRTVFFRDVTRRRRHEHDLHERARREGALARVARLAVAAETLPPLLESAVAIVADTLDVPRSAVLEIGVDGEHVTLRAGVGWPASVVGRPVRCSTPLRTALSLLRSGPISGSAIGMGGPLAPEVAGDVAVASGAGVLIHGHDRPYGVLTAFDVVERPFGPDELAFLEAAAGVIGSALARQDAEAATLEREHVIHAMFERARDAILVADSTGEILEANPAASEVLDLPPGELVGRSMRSFLQGGGRSDAWQRLLANGVAEGDVEVALPGRPPKSFEYSGVAEIVPGRHLIVLRDVTERSQLTARLAFQDKMASLGTMAAGVAHELNNPLAYVSANLAYVGEGLRTILRAVPEAAQLADTGGAPLSTELSRAIEEALLGTERMGVIIRDLLALSRSDDGSHEEVDVVAVLESCIHLASTELRRHARIDRALATVPRVHGNAARLFQVFLNLLVNAAQAIPEGNAAGNRVRVATSASGGRVTVEISDTGTGIRPEDLRRIFDPFFTTKPVGVGTGLGLSICHHIVSSCGGDIRVRSQPGDGTTVEVVLPAVATAAPR